MPFYNSYYRAGAAVDAQQLIFNYILLRAPDYGR